MRKESGEEESIRNYDTPLKIVFFSLIFGILGLQTRSLDSLTTAFPCQRKQLSHCQVSRRSLSDPPVTRQPSQLQVCNFHGRQFGVRRNSRFARWFQLVRHLEKTKNASVQLAGPSSQPARPLMCLHDRSSWMMLRLLSSDQTRRIITRVRYREPGQLCFL
jgi:hypothetical protein